MVQNGAFEAYLKITSFFNFDYDFKILQRKITQETADITLLKIVSYYKFTQASNKAAHGSGCQKVKYGFTRPAWAPIGL